MHHSSQIGTIPLIIWCIVVTPVSIYAQHCIEIARRRRREVRFRVKRTMVSLALYLGGTFVMNAMGYGPVHSIFVGFLMGVAGGFVLVRPPSRNRRIPKRIRQAVIARDLKNVPFDPAFHHLDHIVPYSRGGDHSVENLRVLQKLDNIRRGAKMPTRRELRELSQRNRR